MENSDLSTMIICHSHVSYKSYILLSLVIFLRRHTFIYLYVNIHVWVSMSRWTFTSLDICSWI